MSYMTYLRYDSYKLGCKHSVRRISRTKRKKEKSKNVKFPPTDPSGLDPAIYFYKDYWLICSDGSKYILRHPHETRKVSLESAIGVYLVEHFPQ